MDSQTLEKLINHLKPLKQFLIDYFKKQVENTKNLSKFKIGALSIIGLYVLGGILKNRGFLKKKSVLGKHIVITGGGSGIGKQMAIELGQKGAKISILDINGDLADVTAHLIRHFGGESKGYKCDIGNPDEVKTIFESLHGNFGRVHILINNAGIVIGKNLLDLSANEIQKTFEVNSLSMFYTTKECLPQMMEENEGQIVTIASIAGKGGVSKMVDYCASKHAAVGFNEALRMEMKKKKMNIKTTLICPYYIKTGMFEGVKNMRLSFMTPILTPEYATKRILDGILQEEEEVILPSFFYTVPFMRSILPISICDWISSVTGANSTMDTFKGRK